MTNSKPVVLTGTDYMNLPRGDQPFLVDPILPRGGAVMVFGEPKTGKSFLAIQLCLSLKHGGDFLGFPVRETGEVIYLQLDTPGSLWAARLKELEAADHRVGEIHQADLQTMGTWPFNVLNPAHSLRIRQEVDRIKPIAVVIDTFKEAHQLPENDATDEQKVIGALTEMIQPSAMILVHHSRKPSQDRPEDLINSARGSIYLPGKMDSILMLGKKTLSFTGRALERGSIKIERQDDGLWRPANEEVDQHIAAILELPYSDREKARILAERIKKSEDSCRGLIKRYKKMRS